MKDLFYRIVPVSASVMEVEVWIPYQRPTGTERRAVRSGWRDGTVDGVVGKHASYTSCARTECPLFIHTNINKCKQP